MKSIKVLKFLAIALLLVSVYSCLDDPIEEEPINYTPQREAELLSVYLDTLIERGYDIDTTSMGVYYILEEEGEGEYIQYGDSIGIEYTGMRIDNGSVFDSSQFMEGGVWRFTFKEGNLIDGFEEALMHLNKGAEGWFVIPSELAYGSAGYATIPPYTTLGFSIKLVDIYEE
ncbi:FKBP-type peptidyl-prolyl cis-trans isomerase [Sunxiuqinia elliptica]|uniref:Peptidyl-prolyl cis-trans isomerase n=1 Tax=Sunxiuqinia elliptica TaxID=655355 RepID=A0A1I2JYC6_9BACT|nr:FKBP-type peptidyl-prolyl cis-trans isomerase [Sunxiuqinia elliptica]SFF59892.1 FKBP-type peptidyl-prolyl cis-trans isomerase FkpA [Sunxiuqinia elliptica]